MKKAVFLAMSFIFLAGSVGVAFAEAKGTPRYDELKAIKAKQREERAARKANPSLEEKKPGFWDREAERSGLSKSNMPIAEMLRKMNPVPFLKDQQEKYNVRKQGASAPAAK